MSNQQTELIPWVPLPTMILLHPTLSAEAKVLTICQTLGLSDRMVRIYLRRGEAALRLWYEEERARDAD